MTPVAGSGDPYKIDGANESTPASAIRDAQSTNSSMVRSAPNADLVRIAGVNISLPQLPETGQNLSVADLMSFISTAKLISQAMMREIKNSDARIYELRMRVLELLATAVGSEMSSRLNEYIHLVDDAMASNELIKKQNEANSIRVATAIEQYNAQVDSINARITEINTQNATTTTGTPTYPQYLLLSAISQPLKPFPIPSQGQIDAYNAKILAVNELVSTVNRQLEEMNKPILSFQKLPLLEYRQEIAPQILSHLFNFDMLNATIQGIFTLMHMSDTELDEKKKNEINEKMEKTARELSKKIIAQYNILAPGATVNAADSTTPIPATKIEEMLHRLFTQQDSIRQLRLLFDQATTIAGLQSSLDVSPHAHAISSLLLTYGKEANDSEKIHLQQTIKTYSQSIQNSQLHAVAAQLIESANTTATLKQNALLPIAQTAGIENFTDNEIKELTAELILLQKISLLSIASVALATIQPTLLDATEQLKQGMESYQEALSLLPVNPENQKKIELMISEYTQSIVQQADIHALSTRALLEPAQVFLRNLCILPTEKGFGEQSQTSTMIIV